MNIRPKPDNRCLYFRTGRFLHGQVDASLRELQSPKGMISASGALKSVLREGVALKADAVPCGALRGAVRAGVHCVLQ